MMNVRFKQSGDAIEGIAQGVNAVAASTSLCASDAAKTGRTP